MLVSMRLRMVSSAAWVEGIDRWDVLEAGDVGAGERKGTEELKMEMRKACHARQQGREM